MLNLRFRATRHTYFKTAAQRSLDAAGGKSTADRNPSGFRFLVEDNGLLLIGEALYQRASTPTARHFTDGLVAQSKTVWPRSASLTSTYTLHAARGNYVSLSLGYGRGAAIPPRVADTLTFTVNWSLYL